MVEMNPLEIAVLTKLFAGGHQALVALSRQVEAAKVSSRELTGAGFFTQIQLPAEVPSAPVKSGKIQFGDVEAQIPGLKAGAGFLVYIEDGRLTMLEGYSYEEPWPSNITSFDLRYTDATRSSLIQELVG